MVKAVGKHQEKLIKQKGNNRYHPFKLCIEDQIPMRTSKNYHYAK